MVVLKITVKKVNVTHLCFTLCDPMGYNLPGSCVHGILQTGILEWVAIHFFKGSSPEIKLGTFALQVDSLPPEPLGKLKTCESI